MVLEQVGDGFFWCPQQLGYPCWLQQPYVFPCTNSNMENFQYTLLCVLFLHRKESVLIKINAKGKLYQEQGLEHIMAGRTREDGVP